MATERRRGLRVRCFVSARTTKGEAVLEELSPCGGRLTAGFPAAEGEALPVLVQERSGRETVIRAVVRRVWSTPVGYRLGCEFPEDRMTRMAAARLFARVSGLRPHLQ